MLILTLKIAMGLRAPPVIRTTCTRNPLVSAPWTADSIRARRFDRENTHSLGWNSVGVIVIAILLDHIADPTISTGRLSE